jgi:predicted lipoprotein
LKIKVNTIIGLVHEWDLMSRSIDDFGFQRHWASMILSRFRDSALRPWLMPLALAGLGALGWACRDLGDVDLDGSSSGTGPGDTGPSTTGPGPGESGHVDSSSGGTPSVDRGDVLRSIADQVIVPGTAAFAEQAVAFDAAVQAWAATADPGSATAELDTARAAFRTAMAQWQELEVMQVGPAADSLDVPGGEDRRDAIYSWPTTDTCAVDRALTAEDYAAADFFETELVLVYGLDALEYLLFEQGDTHTCPAQVQLDGPWAALGVDEIERRRAAYSARLSAEVALEGQALAERWAPSGGDFATMLAEPGQGDSPYASEAEALDQVFRAMFYVDKQTKDAKLGVPIGLIAGCPAVPCVSLLELRWSDDSTAAIIANLRALQLLLDGGPDPATATGFDDLLAVIGQQEITDTLRTDIAAAIALAQGLEPPLDQLVASDPAQAQALYEAIKAVTDTLKGPFVMALMLTLPAEGAGDND